MPRKPAATTADKAVTERILWPRAAIIGIRPSRLLSEEADTKDRRITWAVEANQISSPPCWSIRPMLRTPNPRCETSLKLQAPSGCKFQMLSASASREIEAAFATLVRERADALFVAPDAFLGHPQQ